MELDWILVGLVGWALAIVLVLVLTQMAGDQERAAHRLEKRIGHESGTPAGQATSHANAGDRQHGSTDASDPG